MKRALFLAAVVACAAAAPALDSEPAPEPETRGWVGSLVAGPTPEPEAREWAAALPPPPPPPPRAARSAEEEEEERDERANFLSILEELQALAAEEPPRGEYNYFALIGVFSDPSGRPLVFAERVPLDLADLAEDRRRRAVDLAYY